MNDVLKTEYEVVARGMMDSATRAWQAMSVLIAFFLAGGLILNAVIPNDEYPSWFKVSAVWVFFAIEVTAVHFWTLVMTREAFTQFFGQLRRMEIELLSGMRQETYSFLTIHWRQRESDSPTGQVWRRVWQELTDGERAVVEWRIQSGLFGRLPVSRLLAPGIFASRVVLAGLFVAASLTTYYVLD